MHILTFILMFVVGSIAAACKGDMSGLGAIAQIIFWIGFIFFLFWLLAFHPFLFFFGVIGIFVIIFIVCYFQNK